MACRVRKRVKEQRKERRRLSIKRKLVCLNQYKPNSITFYMQSNESVLFLSLSLPFSLSFSFPLSLSFSLITIHSSKFNKSSCLDDSLHFSLISWFVIKWKWFCSSCNTYDCSRITSISLSHYLVNDAIVFFPLLLTTMIWLSSVISVATAVQPEGSNA